MRISDCPLLHQWENVRSAEKSVVVSHVTTMILFADLGVKNPTLSTMSCTAMEPLFPGLFSTFYLFQAIFLNQHTTYTSEICIEKQRRYSCLQIPMQTPSGFHP